MNYFAQLLGVCQESMSKAKITYLCNDCGADFPKWAGQCPACGQWNTLVEFKVADAKVKPFARQASDSPKVVTLDTAKTGAETRNDSGFAELNRVLGGGLVTGSVVLIGGDPGIGKSTLLLQVIAKLGIGLKTLYVSGEESVRQIAMRAKRLGLDTKTINLLTETSADKIIEVAQKGRPEVIVIDSIQTLYSEGISSAPGSVSQVRESSAQLVRFAKRENIAIFLVGHVTKDGTLAGPRVLEHMVDTVLYFEGDPGSKYRVLRAIKNRFGAVNELGVFAMTEDGLKEVTNPSAIFLSRHQQPVPGSVTLVTREGTRPLLVELQALVDDSHTPNPRRVSLGLEQNRLAMLLAVLHRHGSIATYNQDVFINVAGGVRVTETAADLAVVLAILSSLKNDPLPNDLVVFGEIGLSGEIRPVPAGEERLKEAVKHGFTRAIIPKANAPKRKISGMTIVPAARLLDALSAAWE